MADNTLLNVGSGGDSIRDIDRTGTGAPKTQVVALDFGGPGATAEIIGPGALLAAFNANPASATAQPVPTQQAATNFLPSTGSNSTANIAAGATFLGTIESTLSQQAVSIGVYMDQPFTMQYLQYWDAAGTQPLNQVQPVSGVPLPNGKYSASVAYECNGSYNRISVTNTGTAASTVTNITLYYGNIAPTNQSGFAVVSMADSLGNPIASKLIGGGYAESVNPTYAATDSALYNATNVPQVGVVAGKGTDGLVHPLSTDGAGNLNVNVIADAANPTPVSLTNDPMSPVFTQGNDRVDIIAVGGVPLMAGQAIPVALAAPVAVSNFPASQSITAADGALVSIGSVNDAPSLSPAQSSLSAQIKGLNSQMQALVAVQTETLSVLNAILGQLQANGSQLGAAPVSPNFATLLT